MNVESAVGGLRDSPRHSPLSCVVDLAIHRCRAGIIEQRVPVASREQKRHQVFKHRSAPRKQNLAAQGRIRTAQCQPVIHQHIAFGNRHQTGETGFACQQVIVSGEGQRPAHLVSDAEEAPIAVIKKPHVHAVGEILAHLIEPRGAREQCLRQCAHLLMFCSDIRHPCSKLRRDIFFAGRDPKNVSQYVGFVASQFAPGRQIAKQSSACDDRALSQR